MLSPVGRSSKSPDCYLDFTQPGTQSTTLGFTRNDQAWSFDTWIASTLRFVPSDGQALLRLAVAATEARLRRVARLTYRSSAPGLSP